MNPVSLENCVHLTDLVYQVRMVHDEHKRMFQQLATIRPPFLTTITMAFRQIELDDDELKVFWSQLDDLLTSSQFPKLSSVTARLRYYSIRDLANESDLKLLLPKIHRRGLLTE